MTTSLSARLFACISAEFHSVVGVGTQKLEIARNSSIDLANGVGANQADLVFHDNRTIAASSSENLDLAGTLKDPFGTVLTFATIKAILIHADAGNVNDVKIGGAASDAFVGMFADATDIINIKPGGAFMWIAPGTGAAVTPTSADLLKVANGGSGSSVIYDVTIIGTSS